MTVGEIAKNAGYHTATFGKWGMGFFDTEGGGVLPLSKYLEE